MQTVFFRFMPTLVNDVEHLRQDVHDLPEGTTFEQVAHTGVFKLANTPAELTVVNGILSLRAEFAPTDALTYQEDILLLRKPISLRDTLRLRMTGTGYRINRKEVRDFGNVVIGSADTAFVLARAGLSGNAERWEIVPAILPLPFVLDPPTQPIKRNDTLVFRFLFTPKRAGSYSETVMLRRMSNETMVETIEVQLKGNGVRIPRLDTVKLGAILVGDTTSRSKTFKVFGFKPDYRVAYKPRLPFKLLVALPDRPNPKPPDSAMIGVSFSPTSAGTFIDSVVFERLGPGASEIFDTVSFVLVGQALAQEKQQTVLFDSVHAGDTVTKAIEVALPTVPQNVEFTYRLEQIDGGPVKGMIDVAKPTHIPVTFVCKPMAFVPTQTQRFMLHRIADGKTVDSTKILVTTNMATRPLHITIAADTVQARIGDSVDISISYTITPAAQEAYQLVNVALHVGYDPTIFVARTNDTVSVVLNNDSAFAEIKTTNITIPAGSSSGTLALLRGVATMGTADGCTLTLRLLEATTVNQTPVISEENNGRLQITNVWHYPDGSSRYVNSLEGMLTLEVSPNPVATQSTLTVTNVPQGSGRLVIADVLGKVHADVTQQLREGTTMWTLANGSGAAINLGPGTYYARLDVYGINGSEIYSVSRLFVVQ